MRTARRARRALRTVAATLAVAGPTLCLAGAVGVALLGALGAPAAHAGAPVYVPPPPPEPPPPPPPPPPPEPTRYRLLVLDLKAVDVDKATVETLQGFVTTGLAHYEELDVITGQDVKNLVDLEANRAAMGCTEDAACLADIADALGAQLVVFGNCGRLDDDLVMNLNLFDSGHAQSLGRVVVQAGDAKSLARKLRPKMHELVGRFYKQKGLALEPLPEEPAAAPVAAAPATSAGPWPLVTTSAGLVLLAGGATAAVFGYLPLATYQDRRAQVIAHERAFADGEGADALSAASAAQVDMRAAREEWNNLGVFLFDVGLPAAAVGLATTTAGLVWLATSPSAEEEDRAHDHAPSTPPLPATHAGGAR